jgi:hypothetical protein
VLFHQNELEMDNKGAKDSPINIIYDFHPSEELISLVKNHENHFFVGHTSIEIIKGSSQFSDLCIKGSCSYDEEQCDISQNLSQNPIVDNSMPPFSSLSLEMFPDLPIFDKYNDGEEVVEVSEDFVISGISFSSTVQHRDDHKCIYDVVNDSFEEYVEIRDIYHYNQDIGDLRENSHSIDAFDIVSNASTNLGFYKDEIVPFEKPKDDCQIDTSASSSFRSAVYDEGSLQFPDLQTKKDFSIYEEGDGVLESSDQQLILFSPSTKVEQFSLNTETNEGSQ